MRESPEIALKRLRFNFMITGIGMHLHGKNLYWTLKHNASINTYLWKSGTFDYVAQGHHIHLTCYSEICASSRLGGRAHTNLVIRSNILPKALVRSDEIRRAQKAWKSCTNVPLPHFWTISLWLILISHQCCFEMSALWDNFSLIKVFQSNLILW